MKDSKKLKKLIILFTAIEISVILICSLLLSLILFSIHIRMGLIILLVLAVFVGFIVDILLKYLKIYFDKIHHIDEKEVIHERK